MLSYSHFDELCNIDDDMKRMFYEFEAVTGNWSVRELKRQIGSLYYERSGLSKDKHKLSEYVKSIAETNSSKLTVRDPFVFEFLGLKSKEVKYESNLEDAILDNLQNFLLELGHGFCFEARQKRILIGGEHYFVDLVFYNRILKCHVLIELKVEKFSQEHLGQLNTYVNWYRKNEMQDGDNPPVGILLCTKKNHSLVEYALAGMNNQLFVSKYLTNLPDPKEIEKFLNEKMETLTEEEIKIVEGGE
jgi:predicted nuclease of restriction endonuclease-like (RecB) superfamily